MKRQNKSTKRLRELPQAIDRCIPQKIDALYENHWAGNLIAYPTDPDPVRGDEVYRKLGDLSVDPLYWDYRNNGAFKSKLRVRAGQVAWGLRQSMRERKMNEKTYNHISKTPQWRLKLEFAFATVMDDLVGRKGVEEGQSIDSLQISNDEYERKKAIGTYLKPMQWGED